MLSRFIVVLFIIAKIKECPKCSYAGRKVVSTSREHKPKMDGIAAVFDNMGEHGRQSAKCHKPGTGRNIE